MGAKELHDQTVEELEAHCGDLAKELYHLRCEGRQSEKPHLLRTKRRERARALTVLGQKRRGS